MTTRVTLEYFDHHFFLHEKNRTQGLAFPGISQIPPATPFTVQLATSDPSWRWYTCTVMVPIAAKGATFFTPKGMVILGHW